MSKKKKETSQKDLTVIIGITAAGWIAAAFIRNLFTASQTIPTCIIATLLSLLFVLLPAFYFFKKPGTKDSIQEIFFSRIPNGRYVCMAGSISAGSIAIGLLFQAALSIHPISWHTVGLWIMQAVLYYGIAWGAVDEIFFHGFLLNILNDQFGKWISISITTAVYTLAQLFLYYHGQFNFILLLSTILQAVMLAFITLNTKSVWTAAAMHAMLNAIFHQQFITVSSVSDTSSWIHYQLLNAGDVITGGKYGLEGSATVLIGYAIVLIYALFNQSFEVLPPEEENGEKKLVSSASIKMDHDKAEKQSEKKEKISAVPAEKAAPDMMSTVMMKLEKQSEIKKGVLPASSPAKKKEETIPPETEISVEVQHDSSEKNDQLIQLNAEIEAAAAKSRKAMQKEMPEEPEMPPLPPVKDTAPFHTEKIKPIEISGYTGKETHTKHSSTVIHFPEEEQTHVEKVTHLPPLPDQDAHTTGNDIKLPPLPGADKTTASDQAGNTSSSHHSMTPDEVAAARKAAYEKYKSH